ncbi:unnamed protein product [Schistosoma rodhaini]|uniref:SANT and BTB domain-containing protein n=1 Tax=Schistosoma rodhaini TaxID=6188 RepID=A0AA85G269_9TREM|nr:unnamed protein product [Schistosoma rodhaini]
MCPVNGIIKEPIIVTVKVCDEAKGVEQDFRCELDVLMIEMPYFKDFLIKDGQFISEVEILVHCDLKIFEWLLLYARKHIDPDAYKECILTTSNVLALLVSSNFLKMEHLTSECLEYFCKHAGAIIASPFSLDCLGDSLVERIALGLNLEELDKIKDKKDKIKSKIFFKKIEHLFDPQYTSSYCPNNAAYLFRCQKCGKLLTRNISIIIPCLPNRFIISQSGDMIPVHNPMGSSENELISTDESSHQCIEDNEYSKYSHTPKSSMTFSNLHCRSLVTSNTNGQTPMTVIEKLTHFSCTELLIQWFMESGNWRDVFWKLWATINLQLCKRCGQQFPIIELGDGCLYHTMTPIPVQSSQLVNNIVSVKNELSTGLDNCQLGDEYDDISSINRFTSAFKKPENIKFHCINAKPHELLSKKHSESNISNTGLSRHNKPDFIYPCCGSGLSRFNLFPTQTGCHRGEHILNEDSSDPVTKLCIQHRKMIMSWSTKRSFNQNNDISSSDSMINNGPSHNHKIDLNQIICNKELVYKAPAFTLLACLNKQPDKYDKPEISNLFKATINSQPVEPIFETKYEDQLVQINHSKDDDNTVNSLTPIIHSKGLLSSTLDERVWDTGKCNRINQDNQRQEDLRRMQKITEFLCAQRQTTTTCSEITISKEVSFSYILLLQSYNLQIYQFS